MIENAISSNSLYSPCSTLNYSQAAMMGLTGSHGNLQDSQQLNYSSHGNIPNIILTGKALTGSGERGRVKLSSVVLGIRLRCVMCPVDRRREASWCLRRSRPLRTNKRVVSAGHLSPCGLTSCVAAGADATRSNGARCRLPVCRCVRRARPSRPSGSVPRLAPRGLIFVRLLLSAPGGPGLGFAFKMLE